MSGSRENPREKLGNWLAMLPRWRDNSSVHLYSDKVNCFSLSESALYENLIIKFNDTLNYNG